MQVLKHTRALRQLLPAKKNIHRIVFEWWNLTCARKARAKNSTASNPRVSDHIASDMDRQTQQSRWRDGSGTFHLMRILNADSGSLSFQLQMGQATVGKFVTKKASNFNKLQQLSTNGAQQFHINH
jgi:hypothetical protein